MGETQAQYGEGTMEGTWTFNLEEPLVGFTVHAAPWTLKAKRYVAFKRRVRFFATVASVPAEIPPGYRALVSLAVAWKRKARIDLSNILKAVEDGLWVRDRGIGEVHAVKFQHTGIERVSVTVRMEREGSNVEATGRVHSSERKAGKPELAGAGDVGVPAVPDGHDGQVS